MFTRLSTCSWFLIIKCFLCNIAMSSSQIFDVNKIVIKTEPVDSFDWGGHSTNNVLAEKVLQNVDGCGNAFRKDSTLSVACKKEEGEEVMNKKRTRMKHSSYCEDDSSTVANKSLNAHSSNVKQNESREDSYLGHSESYSPQSSPSSRSEKMQDLKPTSTDLDAYSRNASKSNSVPSLSGGENSLGKTLATSLKLIATNSFSSPFNHSPAPSYEESYRVGNVSCASSQASGRATPILVLSPVVPIHLSPNVSPRRYRTRSISKRDKMKAEKEVTSDDAKAKNKDSEHMRPTVNKDGSVTLYQCEECNKVFNKKQTLRQHFITHTDRFACPYCDSRCKSKGDLRTHIQTHTKEKPYHCDVCNTDYTRESILRKHLKTQLHLRACYERDSLARLHKTTGNAEKDVDQFVPTQTKVKLEGFSCSQCPKVLFSKAEYKRHLKSHTFKHVCTVCQRGCKSALLLKIHKNSHNKSTCLACKICLRFFASLYSLKEHLKSHKYGQASRTSSENLIRAAISKHNKGISRMKLQAQPVAGVKNAKDSCESSSQMCKLECEVCHRRFTSEKRLKNHSRIHDKTYICGMCKKSFSTVSKLKLHLKFHDKDLRCEICNACFSDEEQFTDHIQNQHKTNEFLCKICYGRFDSVSDLQNHLNDHAPTKLFSGGSLDESTIPTLNRGQRKPANSGLELSKYSDTDSSTDVDESCSQKKTEKNDGGKPYDSADDSILDSQDFFEIINTALDGSDDNINDTEFSDSDDDLYSGIKSVLEDEVLSSAESDIEEFQELSILKKPMLYGPEDIMKKHHLDFERYSENDPDKQIYKCKLCEITFDDYKYLNNHFKYHVCEYCNKFYLDKEKLAAHKARHVRLLLKQIKLEASRLHIPRIKWNGYLMASSESEHELGDQFLNELEDILEGEPPKAPRSVNFLHSLSHDEIVKANKHIFEQYSCLDLTNNIFACIICKRKYARPTTLTRHFKTHVCQFCNKFFEDKSDLLEHKYRHRKKAALMKAEITGEGSKMPPSPVVSKPNRDMFKRYSYVDSNQNINRCTLCCKDFVRRTVLTRHMKTHICSHCDKFFEDKYDLAKHVTFHKVEKQYMDDDGVDNDEFGEFDEDEKQYSTNSSITGTLDHEEKNLTLPPTFSTSLHHFNPSFHPQPACNSRNETITFIQIPSTESGETGGTQVFSAPGTGTSSFQIISQPVEVYKDTAPDSFLVASASCQGNEPEKIITISQPQIVTSSSEERERLFECGECGKRFFKNGHLKSHMTIHTGDRPYVCRLCGKTFARGTTLRKHEKTHMKRCKICDTTFSHKYELDLHMEIHRTYAFYK